MQGGSLLFSILLSIHSNKPKKVRAYFMLRVNMYKIEVNYGKIP